MDFATGTNAKQLLGAQAHIWNTVFSFHNAMALNCAIQLGIPDAIHKHGKPMTLSELSHSLAITPNKIPSLFRLMRLLVHSNFFTITKLCDEEEAFDLTINSKLLLKDHPLTLAPFTLGMLEPTLIDPSYHLSTWFRNEAQSPFHVAYGRSFWEHTSFAPDINERFNQAMASDSKFVASLLVETRELEGLFKRIKTLVDVGGGNGTTAKVIAEAYPGLKCTVFDLPHVINGLHAKESCMDLVYVGGDMFTMIPHADAVLLKWILHDWSDDHCIRILKLCKEAIPSKESGGKVIIIDIVVETKGESKYHYDTQLLFDMEMMSLNIGGKERTEEEWKLLFIKAGFNDYKIFPLFGLRSVIEVYY